MQLKEALSEAVGMLERNDVGSPRMNAEVLLMLTLNCDRAFLFGHPERELSEDEEARYAAYIRERARGVPSQYITGHQEFWGLDFIVTPAVLIPRPETEHIVEVVKELAGLMDWESVGELRSPAQPGATGPTKIKGNTPGRPKLIDVGTGSGAIAIALAKEFPTAEVMAVDLSDEAVEVAKLNAVRLEVEGRVRIGKSDVMADVRRDGTFDFVVSNPPYVALSEADKVQDVVKKFEPRMAVFAGEHGFDVIDRMIPQAHEALRAGGYLVMEIGYSMSQATMDRLGDWEDVHAVPDLAGIPRVVVARKK